MTQTKKDIAAKQAKKVIDDLVEAIEEQTKQAEVLINKVSLRLASHAHSLNILFQEAREIQQGSKKEFEKVKNRLESLYAEMKEVRPLDRNRFYFNLKSHFSVADVLTN